VPDKLRASGIDPLACLPSSSPVIKQGFDLDARAAWKMLSEHAETFVSGDEVKLLRAQIRELSKLRDKWAHQQPLTIADANRFIETGRKLLDLLNREPEARALRLFGKPFDGRLMDTLDWMLESGQISLPAEQDALLMPLNLDDTLEGHSKLNRLLTHEAATALLSGRPAFVAWLSAGQDGAPTGENDLIAPHFWWTLGLPHDAPVEERRTALKTVRATLAVIPEAPY